MDDMRRAENETFYSLPSRTQMQQRYHSYNHNSPEVYRGPSLQHNPTSNPPLLPPIHHFEAQSMQSAPQFAAVPMNGVHLQHPPSHSPNHYFHYANGHIQPPAMPSNVIPGQNGMLRFPIPPPPPSVTHMGDSRHKKDIKRRTKTGCLTCRKRRIKCDEAHPACRNCQKSKRECLGYDPIFKSQIGPAPIQPAPPSAGTPSAKSTPSTTTFSTFSTKLYQPASNYPGTGGTFVPASRQKHSDGSLDHGASLDPALSGSEQALAIAANNFSTSLEASRREKRISMEQLFSINNIPPRYQEREAPPSDSSSSSQTEEFVRFHFAQGLDRLFETTWYSTRAISHIRQDSKLLDFITQCEEQFRTPDTDSMQSLEARLVWQLAVMPRNASVHGHMNDRLTSDLLPRLDTLEHLLIGQQIPWSKIPPPPIESDNRIYNEQNFWHHLGRICSLPDDRSEQINESLNSMRGVLGMMENRDVLYSIAIARHVGPKIAEFSAGHPLHVTTNDANDEVNKLEVARRFIESEDARGTTQVIQRVCGMAMRSWTLQRQ